jgi:hypothetical protein
MKWIKKYIAAITGDTWTFVGLLIAYWTLTGSAKKATGFLIMVGIVVWLASLPLRENDDDTRD